MNWHARSVTILKIVQLIFKKLCHLPSVFKKLYYKVIQTGENMLCRMMY